MEIKITKNAPQCFQCKKPFVHEEFVWSRLVEVNRDWQREDYCEECWLTQDSGIETISRWHHRYMDVRVLRQRQESISDSPLRVVFYETLESTYTRQNLALAYLCAQLLRREKVFKKLKEMNISSSEGYIIIFLDRVDNRVIEVKDPNFSYAEIEEAKARLTAMLAETNKEDATPISSETA